MLAAFVDVAGIFAELCRIGGCFRFELLADQVRETDDRVQRRAQLMAHRGQKLRLCAIGCLGALLFLTQAFFQRLPLLDLVAQVEVHLFQIVGSLFDAPFQALVRRVQRQFRTTAVNLCLHPGQGDVQVHRLGDVVVGTQLDRLGNAILLVDGRHHDHGQDRGAAVRPDQAQDLEPAHARHHDVEKDDVELVLIDQAQGCRAIFGHDCIVSAACQAACQHGAIGLEVVDDQDARLFFVVHRAPAPSGMRIPLSRHRRLNIWLSCGMP